MKVLAVDVGGSYVKLLVSFGASEPRRFQSGPELAPRPMVDRVKGLTDDWSYDAVSVGVPAVVHAGHIVAEPVNLGSGRIGFDFEGAFGKPTKVVNDAAMQALGSYEGGKMLFLGLGTGLGSALASHPCVQSPTSASSRSISRRSKRSSASGLKRRSRSCASCVSALPRTIRP